MITLNTVPFKLFRSVSLKLHVGSENRSRVVQIWYLSLEFEPYPLKAMCEHHISLGLPVLKKET